MDGHLFPCSEGSSEPRPQGWEPCVRPEAPQGRRARVEAPRGHSERLGSWAVSITPLVRVRRRRYPQGFEVERTMMFHVKRGSWDYLAAFGAAVGATSHSDS